MERLRNLSIRWKVIHIIMLTMTVALLIACASFMTYDYVAFRDQQIKDSQALADVLGTSSTAALSFDDRSAVRETLTSLANKREVTQSRVYAADGTRVRRLSAHGRCGAALVAARRRPRHHRRHGSHRRVQADHAQRRAARHDLPRVRSIAAARRASGASARSSLLVLAGSTVIAFAVAWTLQGFISGPDSAARRRCAGGDDRKVVHDPRRAQTARMRSARWSTASTRCSRRSTSATKSCSSIRRISRRKSPRARPSS